MNEQVKFSCHVTAVPLPTALRQQFTGSGCKPGPNVNNFLPGLKRITVFSRAISLSVSLRFDSDRKTCRLASINTRASSSKTIGDKSYRTMIKKT